MKNVVFMTAMVDAPDTLEYTEWCYKTWEYWCKKNDVIFFESTVYPLSLIHI